MLLFPVYVKPAIAITWVFEALKLNFRQKTFQLVSFYYEFFQKVWGLLDSVLKNHIRKNNSEVFGFCYKKITTGLFNCRQNV